MMTNTDVELNTQSDAGSIRQHFQRSDFRRIMAPGAINAAVMIPLIEQNGSLQVLFELRSSRIEQGGEVCFPGGRIEAGETPAETVVRETVEELLLAEDQVELIAPLYRLTGPAGSEISAFLGMIHDYRGTSSADEVERVFSIPLEQLLSMEAVTHGGKYEMNPDPGFPYELIQNGEQYHWHKVRKQYYFYKTEPEIIWGMTAEILYHFLEELKEQDRKTI